MRRSQRLIAAAVLIALSGALAGCGSTAGFDPSDLLDFLDTKKKLPGDRKPVFPDGVPGLEQGVPKDLYRGARQDDPNAQAATAAPPPVEEPKPKRGTKSKGKQAAAPAAAPAEAEAAPDEEGTTAAAPPPPKPAKIVRKRTTAPPPDQSSAAPAQAPQQSAFPAPVPSGTFTR